MIRNLKVLIAAAMALAVIGALGASGAQAAEFHCSVEPCRVTMKPDGTGKTAHHVILFKDGKGNTFSTTCNTVTGEATMSTKTSTELTISNIVGETCGIGTTNSVFKTNGCHYLIKSAGTLTITCPEGKIMEYIGGVLGSECSYNIPPQGPLSGVKFHNLGTSEVTMEMAVQKLKVTTNGKCPFETSEGEFTTANTILTSETDPGGVMANVWWE